ncbi:ABC transporter substrate-binding protein [Bradyrhizobium liaoningense]|nr:ABC transporter substrate-binding protein [Bradyrhizobium liaoningense]
MAMQRRDFITLLSGAAVGWPLAARAQPKIPRIGFMGNSTVALEANLVDAFREGLRELGYEEGRNIIIEYRWADGKYDRFPVLAAELIAAKVDAIVTAGTPAALAVKKATTTVPLVMVAVGDPIGTGLVPSLARPGGNLTGLSSIAPDLEGKRLQLLREIVPVLSHVAMFVNSLNPFHVSSIKQARAAAQAMRINLQLHDIRKSEDLDDAFAAIRKERPDALLILADRVFLHNRQRIVDFTKEQRLPNVNAYKELVEVGGLISYGPSYEDMHKRAAIYVDKILKGAKPADLPIEQPSKFTFIVNLKAGKELGVTVPSQLLGLADQLIE